ncbi:MAG: hypothetical protein Q9215_005095 [Flavoplaca cf. flavocitrina]
MVEADSKEVFFFEEFRHDDLQAEVAREAQPGRVIKQFKTTLIPDQEDTAKDQKERLFVATYLEVPFKDDIKNQVRALAATWEVLIESCVLTEKLTVLKKYDKDTQNAPGATFSGLRRAFSIDLTMEDRDREKPLEDILSLWLELKMLEIQDKDIKDLCRGLRDANIVVEYARFHDI